MSTALAVRTDLVEPESTTDWAWRYIDRPVAEIAAEVGASMSEALQIKATICDVLWQVVTGGAR